jgi:hypothetical protein
MARFGGDTVTWTREKAEEAGTSALDLAQITQQGFTSAEELMVALTRAILDAARYNELLRVVEAVRVILLPFKVSPAVKKPYEDSLRKALADLDKSDA